jgi:undecaprenyl-diphosphatase
MIKTGQDVPHGQRLILRVWASGTVLTDAGNTRPLWIGSVVAEKIEHLKPLGTLVDEQDGVNEPMQDLKSALSGIQPEARIPPGPNWNGEVLLGQP